MALNFRCEFCEIALKSDLDVSKHIVSEVHRDNVRKAQELHPLELGSSKDTPKNIVKLFESLKLRTVHDVRDLADRGYFRIPPDSPATIEVVSKLNDVLAGIIAANLCSSLPGKAQKNIMESFEARKNEPFNRRHSSHDEPAQKATVSMQPSSSSILTYETAQPQSTGSKTYQPSTSNSRPAPTSTMAGGLPKPGASKVSTITKPQEGMKFGTPVPKSSNNIQAPSPSRPFAATRAVEISTNKFRSGKQTNKSTCQTPRPKPATSHPKPVTSRLKPAAPRPKPAPPRPKPTPPRPKPATSLPKPATPRPKPAPPRPKPAMPCPTGHSSINPQSNVQTSHATPKQAPKPVITISFPNVQQSRTTQTPRMSNPMSMPVATHQQISTHTIPLSPPKAEKRKAPEEFVVVKVEPGPSETFMPKPFSDEPAPQPRPESTYQPKLAKIKIEPEDKD